METLIKKVRNYEGMVLGVHVKEEKLRDAISQNEKIYKCDLLEDSLVGDSSNKKESGSFKTVQIRKLGKIYHKNKADYFLCNIDLTDKYIPYLLRDVFFISKKEICFYGKLDPQKRENFRDLCLRYPVKLEESKEDAYTFFYMKRVSIPRYKSYFYFFVDQINLFLDKITYFLEK